MADAKIRLGSKSKYTIEVNDNGDIISLDLGDPNFISNATDMLEKANELNNEYKDVVDFFNKETKYKNEEEQLKHYSEIGKRLKEMYIQQREILDIFLGENASFKIFGNENYYGMIDDLFEVLKPYMDEAGVRFEEHYKAVRKKYANREERRKNKL